MLGEPANGQAFKSVLLLRNNLRPESLFEITLMGENLDGPAR